EIVAKNINSYLVDAKNVFILKRTKPISKVPEINRGSDAIDDGNLLLNLEEKNDLIEKEPKAEKWIRPFLMGKEFLNNIPRFCLWLKNISPQELKEIPLVYERVQKVKLFREKSKRPQTLKAAMFPTLFGEERHPESDYLAIPKVSSENREYIPIGYCSKDIICGDKLFNLPNASLFHFGIITSLMHNTWMRYTCGRMKSDYSYSNTIVYNNYPWPENPSDKQKEAVEKAAQAVLDARSMFPESSLADLYDPNTMPPALVKAHQQLDKAVDLCYRPQPFPNETKRIEFLFELYDRYTAGLFTKEKKGRKKVGKK
ncbi:MAG: class I SAM-dependent DNA methyltransferase, partial [Bacteroidetes bacterium]|nr:class I SAM-dependent DNA methyltransferase [Bacteroidota bacterium]